MKFTKKLFALLLCVVMLLASVAVAEQTTETGAELAPLAGETIIAKLGDVEITWAMAEQGYNSLVQNYGSMYDLSDPLNEQFFRAVATENAVLTQLMVIKAKEFGFDKLTEEDTKAIQEATDRQWNEAINNYIMNNAKLTEVSTEEEMAAAEAEAVKYFNDMGITTELLIEQNKQYMIISKVESEVIKDATVSDEEVEAYYQELVNQDKALYENNIVEYVNYNMYVEQMAMYAQMGMGGEALDHAWYKPEGFRGVKHILLPVDAELLNKYTELQARYEEQMNAEEAAIDSEVKEPAEDETKEDETKEEVVPVTEKDITDAQAAIMQSIAPIAEEINAKILDGVSFDELIATYAVNEKGEPTDPGMLSEPYKTIGYEVCEQSVNYVPGFVKASMSVNEVGEVSAPYLSDYGVHIVKYISDIPGGPVPMTDMEREQKKHQLLAEKQNKLYEDKMKQWLDESNIEYMDVIPTVDETIALLESQMNSETATESEAPTEEETK